MNKPPRDKTYSDVMNEWAAQRSFINQMRSRIFHPPYDAPWYGKLWGYLWRVGVVVGAFLIFAYVSLKMRLSTPGFRAHIAEEVGKRYNATNVTCGKTNASLWNDECTISALEADGAEGCFFNHMDAHQINFDLGDQFLRTDWHIQQLSINELNLTLRSGSYNPNASRPGATPAPAPPVPNRLTVPELRTSSVAPKQHLKLAGFGLTPDFGELSIHSYEVKQLGLRWGYTTTTAGRLDGANATLEPTKTNGWSFWSSCGEFSQNWLTGLKVSALEVRLEDTLVFEKAEFTRSTGGRVSMSGSMTLGELPQLDLAVHGRGLNLKTFVPSAFSGYFDATGDLDGKITGTINRLTGVKTQFRVNLVPPAKESNYKPAPGLDKQGGVAWIKNVPLFSGLYVASGEDSLSQPVVTRGSFNLETSEGTMVISDLKLECGDMIQIRGGMECSETQSQPSTLDGAQGAPMVKYNLKTNLMIGLPQALVEGMPKNIQTTYFTKEIDGMKWMELKLEGEDGSALTKALKEDLSRLQKESLTERSR